MKSLLVWARLCLLTTVIFGLLPNSMIASSGPTISAQPQPAYVNLGAATTLSVTASASTALTYQWQLNGGNIPGANAASLTISNAQTNESGNYDVIVTAGGVSVTSALATVTVISPPSLGTALTTPVVAFDGQSVQIYPNIQGSDPITYVWKKDGVAIPSQQSYYLYISPVTTATAGSYVVVATNSAGTFTTDPVVVTVVEPITITLSSDQTVAANANVTLTGTVTGPGSLTYQWYGPTGLIAGATSTSLVLTNVSSLSSGNYNLSVTNAYQTVSGNGTNLTVNAPPSFPNQLGDLTVYSGNYSSFYDGAVGTGQITYQWKKDGVNLVASNKYSSGVTSYYLSISGATSADQGVYTVVATNAYGSTTSNGGTLTVTLAPNSPVITTQPASVNSTAGSNVSFSVAATDPVTWDTMTYQWYKDSQQIAGAIASTLTVASVSSSDAGSYTVQVTNAYGATISSPATLTVGPAATLPVITQQPQNQNANVGDSITLTAAASGNPAPSFQWQKNSANIAGATGASLALTNVQTTDSGSYSVIATNVAGSASSASATVTVAALPQTRVINLSTRAQVGTGDNILIAGFIINGSTSKKMLIRALGPTLANYSVANPLADPSLRIVDGAGNTVATNDDWGNSTNIDEFNAASAQVKAVPLPANSKDSALVVTLPPGGYTALVSGNAGATGIALVELYEVDTNTANQLINISSRADVSTGDGVTIAGIIVSGNAPKKFLVRAIGPGLKARGVAAFLSDPKFDIIDSNNTTIATNDNWETSDTIADTRAVSTALNVSPLDAGSKDSALTVTLAPGGYTVIVRGVNNATGIALVELYQVP